MLSDDRAATPAATVPGESPPVPAPAAGAGRVHRVEPASVVDPVVDEVVDEVQALAQARRRARTVADITSGLSGSLNVRRTVLQVLDLTRPRLADWSALVVPEPGGGALSVFGGADARFRDTVPIAADAGDRAADRALDRVLRSGRTELLHVAAGEGGREALRSLIPHSALVQEAAGLRPADLLGVALSARGSVVGALILLRADGGGFCAEDVAIVELIAERAAQSLDAARLYQERARTAAVLQAGLRPPTVPEVPGVRLAARFRPAAEHLDIGGDFYDFHGDGEDWLLVLGDVCGKGVEAAVLTGRARQSIRTAAHFDRRPARVLSVLNSVLYEEDSDRFVTAVCARVHPAADGRSARVDLAVAGHPPPLIVRRDGRIEQVEAGGTLAGVLPEVSYAPTQVRLESGDVLLMFTDGVHEARGRAGFYGMDRLRALMQAYAGAGVEVLSEAVEQDVVEFLDGSPHDDIALLAMTPGR